MKKLITVLTVVAVATLAPATLSFAGDCCPGKKADKTEAEKEKDKKDKEKA